MFDTCQHSATHVPVQVKACIDMREKRAIMHANVCIHTRPCSRVGQEVELYMTCGTAVLTDQVKMLSFHFLGIFLSDL